MARRVWNRMLRQEIADNAKVHYDSSKLIEESVRRDLKKDPGLRGYTYDCWRTWNPHREKLKPPTEAVWVDHFVFHWVAEWLSKQTRPTIVWYQHQTVGEMLGAIGLEVFGAGTSQPAFEGKHIACSIAVHGTGKNLQAWDQILVIEPPSSGKTWEQLVGRVHRQGQLSDRVDAYVLCHTDVLDGCMDKACDEAEYTFDLTNCLQRLQRATWSKTDRVAEK